ncbi:MAG: cyclic nucleotide-binding domain-containing protein [Proteobacteria bacterium]|nr:cyclic nucleotide-binding domain-containing protein [Pseudomonadota bacterium]MBU1715050.1 cyclic nucleotide-binding domain-containing protein [Pseudomonadota bacterium]
MDDIARHRELVNKYVRENNNIAAIKSLLFLIARYADNKDFRRAEALREKIIELDPMSLSEIIKANEIIDEARRMPVDKTHRDIWADLYEKLNADESNTLYVDMEDLTFGPDEVIFNQGDMNSKLYFINSGQVKHLFHINSRDLFIKKLTPGSIAGDDTFFDASVCTTSLVTLSRVKLSYVDREVLAKWKQSAPALESKLQDYCLGQEKIHNLLKKNAMDRRGQRRTNLSGKVLIKLVNEDGQPVGKTLGGILADISIGGLSFFIKARQKASAQQLLGRTLNVQFLLPPSMQEIDKNGTAIGVNFNLDNFQIKNDYSVHIKFDKKLTPAQLAAAEQSNRYR